MEQIDIPTTGFFLICWTFRLAFIVAPTRPRSGYPSRTTNLISGFPSEIVARAATCGPDITVESFSFNVMFSYRSDMHPPGYVSIMEPWLTPGCSHAAQIRKTGNLLLYRCTPRSMCMNMRKNSKHVRQIFQIPPYYYGASFCDYLYL